jgi:hypothetical protein
MSGAASTLHNININFAAATRGGCGVTHPLGSSDLRQRRHSSPLRPLPRVALWSNHRSREGFGHSGEPRGQQLPNQIPLPAQSSPRHR